MKKTICTFIVGIAVVFSAVNFVKTNYAVEDFTQEIVSEVADEPIVYNKMFKVKSAMAGKKNPVCYICREGESIAPEKLQNLDRDVIVCHLSSKDKDIMETALEGLVGLMGDKPAPAYAADLK